jgi:hypothetical protein
VLARFLILVRVVATGRKLGGDLQSMMSSNEAIVDVEEGHIKGFPVIE